MLGIHNYQNNYPVLKRFAKFHSNRSCISGVNVIQTILKKELYIATARDVCCTLRHTNVCEYDKFCGELTFPIEKNLIVAIPAMLFLDVVVIRELSFLPMLNFEHRRGVGRQFGIYFQLLLFLG